MREIPPAEGTPFEPEPKKRLPLCGGCDCDLTDENHELGDGLCDDCCEELDDDDDSELDSDLEDDAHPTRLALAIPPPRLRPGLPSPAPARGTTWEDGSQIDRTPVHAIRDVVRKQHHPKDRRSIQATRAALPEPARWASGTEVRPGAVRTL